MARPLAWAHSRSFHKMLFGSQAMCREEGACLCLDIVHLTVAFPVDTGAQTRSRGSGSPPRCIYFPVALWPQGSRKTRVQSAGVACSPGRCWETGTGGESLCPRCPTSGLGQGGLTQTEWTGRSLSSCEAGPWPSGIAGPGFPDVGDHMCSLDT